MPAKRSVKDLRIIRTFYESPNNLVTTLVRELIQDLIDEVIESRRAIKQLQAVIAQERQAVKEKESRDRAGQELQHFIDRS